jgi:hypothetical protein
MWQIHLQDQGSVSRTLNASINHYLVLLVIYLFTYVLQASLRQQHIGDHLSVSGMSQARLLHYILNCNKASKQQRQRVMHSAVDREERYQCRTLWQYQ